MANQKPVLVKRERVSGLRAPRRFSSASGLPKRAAQFYIRPLVRNGLRWLVYFGHRDASMNAALYLPPGDTHTQVMGEHSKTTFVIHVVGCVPIPIRTTGIRSIIIIRPAAHRRPPLSSKTQDPKCFTAYATRFAPRVKTLGVCLTRNHALPAPQQFPHFDQIARRVFVLSPADIFQIERHSQMRANFIQFRVRVRQFFARLFVVRRVDQVSLKAQRVLLQSRRQDKALMARKFCRERQKPFYEIVRFGKNRRLFHCP